MRLAGLENPYPSGVIIEVVAKGKTSSGSSWAPTFEADADEEERDLPDRAEKGKADDFDNG